MIEWLNDTTIRINTSLLHVIAADQPLKAINGIQDRLVIQKTRPMLSRYQAIKDDLGTRHSALGPSIFEIGMFQGGSCAYFCEFFSAHKLVAVDRTQHPSNRLSTYLDEHALHERIRPYYGVDQASTTRLREIIRHEFTPQGIDILIDDASHLLRPTQSTFNTCFPHLNPGGYYIIEDWTWAHPPLGAQAQNAAIIDPKILQNIFGTEAPLSLMAMKLVMACACRPDIFESLQINETFVAVKRGPGSIADPRAFDLSDYYTIRNIEYAQPPDLPW